MLIKYMGLSDVREFFAGETFSGAVPALPVNVVFSISAGHVVDTANPVFSAVPAGFWTKLLTYNEFIDVTGQTPAPSSQWDNTYTPGGASVQLTPLDRVKGPLNPGDTIKWDGTEWVPNTVGAYVGTPGLVYDGVTDNYGTIMNALAENGICILGSGIGQAAVSQPVLLEAAQGLLGYADVNPAGNAIKGAALVPTTGFNPALTSAQQSKYPALGATASAPVVCAGVETFIRGVLVSGASKTDSAVIIGNAQPAFETAAFLGGTVCTVKDLGNAAGQGKINGVVIRCGTAPLCIDLETFDWLIANFRCTGGSKIFNAGGTKLTDVHFTGSGTGYGFNLQIGAAMTMDGVYVDSGAASDLIELAVASATSPTVLRDVTLANNSAANITNVVNRVSGSGPLVIDGLVIASSTFKFGALLANAGADDIVRAGPLSSTNLVSSALTALFPNGTPGYYEVSTF